MGFDSRTYSRVMAQSIHNDVCVGPWAGVDAEQRQSLGSNKRKSMMRNELQIVLNNREIAFKFTSMAPRTSDLNGFPILYPSDTCIGKKDVDMVVWLMVSQIPLTRLLRSSV